MKRYLLDTSLLAAYLHNRKAAVSLISSWVQQDEAATSMLVYGEVIEYLKGLPNYQEKYATFHTILNEIPPYPLTYAILERYADIRRTLRPLHQDIGDIDTLIAATALEEHVTLVTIDRDFERVPH
jgi:tRNA(fMet)-specific endonuclease VapC